MRAARTASLNLRERWKNRRPGVADADEMRVWPLVLRSLALNLRSGMSLHEAVQSLSYPEEHPRIGEDIRRFIRALETTSAWGLSPHLACEQVLSEGERSLRPHSRERLRDLSLSLRMSENAGAPLATSLERAAEHAEERIDALLGRQSALAAPRATGRILSWLPLIGLGLGMLMGSDPLGVLTGSVDSSWLLSGEDGRPGWCIGPRRRARAGAPRSLSPSDSVGTSRGSRPVVRLDASALWDARLWGTRKPALHPARRAAEGRALATFGPDGSRRGPEQRAAANDMPPTANGSHLGGGLGRNHHGKLGPAEGRTRPGLHRR